MEPRSAKKVWKGELSKVSKLSKKIVFGTREGGGSECWLICDSFDVDSVCVFECMWLNVTRLTRACVSALPLIEPNKRKIFCCGNSTSVGDKIHHGRDAARNSIDLRSGQAQGKQCRS